MGYKPKKKSSNKKDQNKIWNKNSDKNLSTKPQLSDGIDRNWHFWTWISSSDSIIE